MSPSPWVMRFAAQFAPGARVLDLACGAGRHVRALQARGHPVTAVDRDSIALQHLPADTECLQADLEAAPWPLAGRTFDAVVVTNYLWRPLLPHIVQAVAPGGWLIYETFAVDHASIGRPSNPDFLLQRGELLQAVAGRLRVVAFEDGHLPDPERFVQRIAAVRDDPAAAAPQPVRYRL